MKIQNSAPVYQPKRVVAAQTDAAAAPTPPAAATPVAAKSFFSGITGFFKNAWSGIVDFFKGLFGKK
ncbi:MAG TPA: hypothetical protein V6C82_10155 [Chroococcales cyanobacterium]